MEDLDPSTERTLKEGLQEGFEIDKFLGRAGLGEVSPLATTRAQKSCSAPMRL